MAMNGWFLTLSDAFINSYKTLAFKCSD